MLYRFRSTEKLLKGKELETQYFFLSNAKNLNDCLEGYVEFYWQGDFIAWLCLFKNYAWGIFWQITHKFLFMDLQRRTVEDGYLSVSECFLKGSKFYENRLLIESKISDNEQLIKLARMLADSHIKLTEEELTAVLFIGVHAPVLQCLNPILNQSGIPSIEMGINPEQGYQAIFQMEDDAAIHAALQSVQMVSSGLLLSARERADCLDEQHKRQMNYFITLHMEFPGQYVRQIQTLSFADAYITCFNDDVSNPAMWSHYADNNKGACLIFKNEPETEINLSLKMDDKQTKRYKLQKIEYGTEPPKINFFSSLVCLFGDERKHWLNHCGKDSEILTWLYENTETARKRYIQNSTNRFLRKSKGWKNEQEYRIILCDYMQEFSEPLRLYYNFYDLYGIAFGMKTSAEDKIRIMKIVRDKCRKCGRDDFVFYQAVYHARKDEIVLEKIMNSKHLRNENG